MKHWIQSKLNRIWYHQEKSYLTLILIPLSMLYAGILWCCRKIKLKPYQSRVPVIVLGNLTVGGSGKTPAILALVRLMQTKGWRVGVVSRGYPINPRYPILVHEHSRVEEVGDEPLLLFKKTGVPVCVCKNRVAAIKTLENEEIDFILSDDGLQNFSFKHDIEIVLIDAKRQFGNGELLPAGPLREPLTRLQHVDLVVEKVNVLAIPEAHASPLQLILSSKHFISLTSSQSVSAGYFQNKKVVAITAIAYPEDFFKSLTSMGIQFETHAFHDHYLFKAKDFKTFGEAEILMTEKDAVKCLSFANEHFWCLPLEGKFSEELIKKLFVLLTHLMQEKRRKLFQED